MKRMMKYAAVTLFLMGGFAAVYGQGRMTAVEYIEKYKHLAVTDQDIYGIPASITMAQGLLESDCGNSRLAVEGNNHFGIKCKNDWTGSTISHDDDAPGECFRKYSTAEDSYRDHSEFLDKSPRYQALFDLDVTDYKGWARGLKAAGYATNPRYAELLIKIIEENRLYELDTQGDLADLSPASPRETSDNVKPSDSQAAYTASEKIDVDNYVVSVRSIGGYPVYHNNGSEFVVARQNDTYGRMASVLGVSEKRLRKFNDADAVSQPRAGVQVYIRPKANKAANGRLLHIVKSGETMHSISQVYGIKLKRLAKINRRSADAVLSPGQQIRLM